MVVHQYRYYQTAASLAAQRRHKNTPNPKNNPKHAKRDGDEHLLPYTPHTHKLFHLKHPI